RCWSAARGGWPPACAPCWKPCWRKWAATSINSRHRRASVKTFTACEPPLRYSLSAPTTGSRFTAVFFAAAGLDTRRIQAELQAAVDRVDAQMSTWKPASTLMRLSRTPLGEWFELPDELYQVLLAGLHVGSLSHGTFDIALGAQV